jgi:K+-sensing histidine kinase KdpD
MGFLIGLVILPLYVSVLSERIKEAKRRADEASKAKGRFVANVSHEMRTPLNGVIAMADILRETDLSEAQREIVETMTTSAQLLLAQIEDVLDMAKIEAGRVQVESRPFDLAKRAFVHRQGHRAASALQRHRRSHRSLRTGLAMVRRRLAPLAASAPEPVIERDQVHGARADRYPGERRRHTRSAGQTAEAGS